MSTAVKRKLKPIQLAAVIFLTVSGGPYGLEPLLQQTGSNAAFLLLLVTPLLWDIPTIFAILELNSLMPVTGGYYQWVKRALGLRWAFYEGWWTWLYTFADLAIYPVLFVQYLSFFFPQAEAYKIPVCLFIIWISAGINVLGIVPVGKVSLVLSALVLIPFLLLFGWSLMQHNGHLIIPTPSFKSTSFSNVGLGLYTVMWNFIGWDNVTTYAEEVDKPVRSYLVSVFVAFVAVLSIYLIATLISVNANMNPTILSEQGFPALGWLVGGDVLGGIIAMGGMASALGLYSAVLLSVSRIPEVMAEDGLLPKKLGALHPKYKSPYASIICCSVVVSVMVFWSFGELLIIDITLYGAALLLEYVALIRLRKLASQEHRPFKIPLNRAGLVCLALLPFSVYIVALTGAFLNSEKALAPALFALAALTSAEVVWLFVQRRKRKRFSF
ncbi:APC family permease [Flavisolibacter ginsenosidimutans]|uniref:APC family permease n=1 Tax=Flavisolibacter ginsenosidimutans TaxID=661481 RepID=A0A5B8UKP1_9BACT|nr:APC family permease [Flavisolibacter ginsenosidimutans]QEC57261.1 APC family permease [Flavisolibacter ginsenosidimutans]